MGIKEEVVEMREELEMMKQESFAMEILKDYKKANKRQFIIIILLLIMFFCTTGYLVYVLNDIGVEETTQEVTEVETINGSVVNQGDVYGQDKTN